MKTNYILLSNRLMKLAVTFATLSLVIGCTGTTEDTTSGGGGTTGSTACVSQYSSFVNNNINSSAVVAAQGGALYDEWWGAAGFAGGPTSDHPIWSDQITNTASGEDTWRCKECHGWDYKGKDGNYGPGSDHFTNFPGIWNARTDSPINVFCAIHSGTGIDSRHKFNADTTNGALSDLSILQLTKFITISQSETASDPAPKGLLDSTAYINATTGLSLGNAANGKTLYESTGVGCASGNCHGTDGTVQHEPLGTLANENAWEILHKIRFGDAGVPVMPQFADVRFPNSLTLSEIADIIAYAQQSLPDPGAGTGTPPAAGDLAMIAMGGQLYDHWMEEKNVTPPVNNPLWSMQTSNTRTGADTWRCKECHGWDYKGADGVYGPNSDHYTGFGGVYDVAMDPLVTEADLIDFLTNGFFLPVTQSTVHNFAGLLTDTEIQALAKFIKMGVIDTRPYITNSGFILGSSTNFANGEDLYSVKPFGTANGNCALCHGADGKGQPPAIVGEVAVNNPWEGLHKVRFGQPNSQMPALIEAVIPGTTTPAFDTQDAVDIIFYAQSLPQQ